MQWKPRIGCSSIAFGATPAWPWSKSKNATPVSCARAHGRNARRAAAICACRTGNARLSHVGAGDSVIIVRRPSLSTTWKSSSDSWRINTTLAITVKMCRSNGSLVSGKLAGAGREVRNAIVVCLRRQQRRPVLKRLHRPAFDAALDPPAGRSRLLDARGDERNQRENDGGEEAASHESILTPRRRRCASRQARDTTEVAVDRP
jgi:hypothetical protein